ncbi:hypothetical protein [Salinivirga cyanobacteriivorans]
MLIIMTGGAGHTRDMQNRLRQNRNLRTSQKDKYSLRKRSAASNKHNKNIPSHQELSAEVKNTISKKVREKKKREVIVSISIIIALIAVTIVLIATLTV